MPRILVLVAGLPREILGPFITRLKNNYAKLDVLETLPLDSGSYTPGYAEDLYRKLGSGLRTTDGAGPGAWWGLNLIVLFLRKRDRSECHLVERFGLEALLVPLEMETTTRRGPRRHMARATVNALTSQSNRLLRHARIVLSLLAEEVTNRDSRTCILLPRANFGSQFETVKEYVQGAVKSFKSAGAFRKKLKSVGNRLAKSPDGRFRNGRLVFRAPARAGARHGLAPPWDTKEHDDRCVIRGRVRFGVPYDPKFHYDCDLARTGRRSFTSCHGETRLKPGRSHVNIAPNDNIR